MSKWLQTLYDRGVLGVPGVHPQKTDDFGVVPSVPLGVPGVLEHPAGTPGTLGGTPAQAVNPLKSNEEHREHREHPFSGEESWHSWRKAVLALDPVQPLGSFTQHEWATLYDASVWWLNNFGGQAARDGWTAADIFGVRPGYAGLGGMIERLGHCRSLIMTNDLAKWKWLSVTSTFARGAYPDLRPFWEPVP